MSDTKKTTNTAVGTVETSSTGSTDPSTASATALSPAAEQRFLVDTVEVSREAYLKAASENGYDLARMPENYFPSISTKNHGEK